MYIHTHVSVSIPCIHQYFHVNLKMPWTSLGKHPSYWLTAVASRTEEWEARGPGREKLLLLLLWYILFVDGLSGTQKEHDLVCRNMELERGGHRLRPPNLVVSRPFRHQERATRLASPYWNRFKGSWSLHFIFILQSSFLWASSASCRVLYPSYRQKIPGFGDWDSYGS